MKVAILGANGYLGRHLTRELDAQGTYDFILIDRSILAEVPISRCTVMQKDISCPNDREDIARAIITCDAVCYKMGLLGIPNLTDDVEYLKQYLEQNVNSFFELMLRCNELDPGFLGRVSILVDSSVMRFGGTEHTLYVDEDSIGELPHNYYGLSKHGLEAICDYLKAIFDANIHILRYTRVTSATAKNVISTFVERARKNQDILLTGNVDKRLNFVHIKDATNLSSALLGKKIPAGVWHCGGADNVTLMELAQSVLEVVSSDSVIVVDRSAPNKLREIEQLYFSDVKTRRVLDLPEACSLHKIIHELI